MEAVYLIHLDHFSFLWLIFNGFRGDVKKTSKGAIISTQEGTTTAYALKDVESKGRLYVGPGEKVYPGMVIGEHVLETGKHYPNPLHNLTLIDMEMNPCKTKKATNIRAAGSDEQIKLVPKTVVSLEDAITQARDDEVVELTPKSVRVRKMVLDRDQRRRDRRQQKSKG